MPSVGEILEDFPLFPLGLVLLPGEYVPLHIFEERYKTMIDECLESPSEFGILWLSDEGLKEVGCRAAITELLERTDDGRMNILCRGTAPFRLLRRVESLPYPAGVIENLGDDDPRVEPGLGEKVRERYADLVERVTDKRPEGDDLGRLDAYGMAATVDFAPEAKQSLLESRSEGERMRMVGEMFAVAMNRLDYVDRAMERAKSNGKVRP